MTRTPSWIAIFVAGLTATVFSTACDDPPTQPSGDSAAATPVVAQVFPTSGPTESRVPVVIRGSGFAPGALVTIGGAATDVVISATTISAVAPLHAAGAVDVIVTNTSGRSGRLPEGYRFVPVAVTSVSPAEGFPHLTVTIHGTGFLTGATVTFGGVEAVVEVVTGSTVRARVPAQLTGLVGVSVANPGGQRGDLDPAFTSRALVLTVDRTVVTADGFIRVSWAAPNGRFSADWIGLFRIGAQNTEYGWWEYTNGQADGTFVVPAPLVAGRYEFRYLLNDGYFDVARSETIDVGASAPSLRR